jgi:hypothetical protein
MQDYYEQKNRFSGSVLMQSAEAKGQFEEKYFALKKKFEETIDNYEGMIQEAINQIQQLELALDDRTSQLHFAAEARDKYLEELVKKNVQIEDLGHLVHSKECEIQHLKQFIHNGTTETNNRLDIERQEHAHEVYELRRTVTAQQTEIVSIQKRYSELESKSRRLQARLKTHEDSCRSTKSGSQLKNEARLRHLLSIRKERPKENHNPRVFKRASLQAHNNMHMALEAIRNDGPIKEADQQILEPVNLGEEMFDMVPKINLSDLCRTPSSERPSPTTKKPKLISQDSLNNNNDFFPLKEVSNTYQLIPPEDRRTSNSHVKNRFSYSASATELEHMIKRSGCKNLSCDCERQAKLPITSKRTCSSLCSIFWIALKSLADHTSRVFSRGRRNEAEYKIN